MDTLSPREIQVLSENGYCCSLHFSYPRFRASLDPQRLGFLISGQERSMVPMPSLCLLIGHLRPLEKIVGRTRRTFTERTLGLGAGNTGLRFCPIKAIPDLLSSQTANKEAFEQAVAEFRNGFQDALAEVKPRWSDWIDRQTILTEEQKEALRSHVFAKLAQPVPPASAFSMQTSWRSLAAPGEPVLKEVEDSVMTETKEAITRIRAEAGREIQHFSVSFKQRCKKELVERMQAFFASLSSTVQGGKTVNIRTVRKINSFLDNVNQLAFMDDKELDSLMGDMKSALLLNDGSLPEASIQEEDHIQSIRQSIDSALSSLDRMSLEAEQGTEGNSIDNAVDMEADEGTTPKVQASSENEDEDDSIDFLDAII